MKKIKTISLIIIAVLGWTVFVGLGFIDGYLLRPIDSTRSLQGFVEVVKEKLETEYVGNLALVLIENGEVKETLFHSADNKQVNAQSAFPVASISKWVTSVAVHKLVEEGKLNLDEPVEKYLTRWHLPESDFDNHQVTIRRLLSHSAGFDDDLGYGGFSADEQIQTIEESLSSAADGYYEGAKARVGYEPGTQFMYSGASYTLLQLIIEEVTGVSFSDYMNEGVFKPLDMKNSSFLLSDSNKIGLVEVYKTDGSTRPMKRFTAKAAASLMTSIDDLSTFMISLAANNDGILKKSSVQAMTQPESFRNGVPYYGLGPKLHSPTHKDALIIGHDGSGNDAINSTARIDLNSKDGIIILETGHYSLASDMTDEWLYWKAGIADRVVMERNMPYLIKLLVSGYLVTLIIVVFWFRNKRKANRS